jgi:hypothetical protein
MLNAIANDNDSHSRAPTPRFAFFHKIGAWAPVRSQYNFDHITQKRVTNLPAKGQVFFFDLVGATAPVRKRSAYSMVYLAPIIVCFRRVVKSFL